MIVAPSARKHGISDEDAIAAAQTALRVGPLNVRPSSYVENGGRSGGVMTDDHAVRATYLDRKHDDADTMWMWATVFLFAMLAVPIYLGYRLGLWLFGNDLRDSAVEQPRPNPVHYKNPIHSQKEHMLPELPR